MDGLTIPAYLYLPRGAKDDHATPAVVLVHGGPEFQARPWFDPVTQYFAAAGYAVFVPNVRGSTGYGKVYADADNREKRTDAIWDVTRAWAFLAREPWCDATKVGIMGSS